MNSKKDAMLDFMSGDQIWKRRIRLRTRIDLNAINIIVTLQCRAIDYLLYEFEFIAKFFSIIVI